MLLSLMIPLSFVLVNKWNWNEIGFAGTDWIRCKKAVYFLPLTVILIPVAVKGLYIKSAADLWGNLFLYFMVGFAEEVYFRGIIPNELGKAFSRRSVIFLSAAFFGIGHIAAAFTADSGIVVMSGRELLAAECVRGTVMAAGTVWLAVILMKQNNRMEYGR